MARTPARSMTGWLAMAVAAAGLSGCGSPMPVRTPPAPVPAPQPLPAPAPAPAPVAAPEPAPAPAPAPAAQGPESAGVAARFPEPAVNYRTPALLDGRAGFTTNAELQTAMRALVTDALPTSVRLVALGNSQNGVPLEALMLTRHNDPSPAGLLRSGRPTVLLVGQQHGDEPAGAEALLVVAQELSTGRLQKVLDQINVVILPRANPDGAQAGQRASANGVDINRDHLLLKTPEARAQALLVREFQPLVVVDAHEYTVAGRYVQKFNAVQRYDALLQYAMTANLSEFMQRASEEWFRQPLLAGLKQQDLSAEWYYTTSTDIADQKLSMGGTQPDTGRNVNGLKNTVSFLIETRGVGIGRANLKRRVHTHVTAIASVLQSTAERSGDLFKLRHYVEADTSAQACQGNVVVQAAPTPTEYTVTMLDPATGADRSLTVNWDSALTLRELKSRRRPCGYWLAADQSDAASRLRQLGVRVDQVTANGVMQGESYLETSRKQAARQDVRGTVADGGSAGVVQVEVQLARALLDAPVGSYYVPLSQPLANLVVAALEPDTQNSYFANGIVSDLRKQARIMFPPALKLNAVP